MKHRNNHKKPLIEYSKVYAKIMLAGEYTILSGASDALACTVNKAMTVGISSNQTLDDHDNINSNLPCKKKINKNNKKNGHKNNNKKKDQNHKLILYIKSCIFPNNQDIVILKKTDKDHLDKKFINNRLELIIRSVLSLAKYLDSYQAYDIFKQLTDVYIDIKSDINISYGLGSSSALIISIIKSFSSLLNFKLDIEIITEIATATQKSYQSYSSGYDIITQLHGGLIRCKKYKYQDSDNTNNTDKANNTGCEKLIVCNKTDQIDQINNINYLNKYLKIFICADQGQLTKELIISNVGFFKNEQFSKKLASLHNNLIEKIMQKKEVESIIVTLKYIRDLMSKTNAYPKKIISLIDELKHLSYFDQRISIKPSGAGGLDAIICIAKTDNDLTNSFLKTMKSYGYILDPDIKFCYNPA